MKKVSVFRFQVSGGGVRGIGWAGCVVARDGGSFGLQPLAGGPPMNGSGTCEVELIRFPIPFAILNLIKPFFSHKTSLKP
jgi:hypothetical protein